MKIGIDAHNLEGQQTGVGRYLKGLLVSWDRFNLRNDLQFILYFKKEIPADLNLSNSAFKKQLIQAPLAFQSNAFFIHWLLPRAAEKDKVDILFCPGYIAPIIYSSRIALTLHDIIYQARPELYNWPSIFDKILLKWVSKKSAQKAEIIFTPSEFSKREILKYYQVADNKVITTPLAADKDFRLIRDTAKLAAVKGKYQIKDKFIFYIGSIFNRRHLPELIQAFEKTAAQLTNYQFLIIGANHTAPFIDVDKLIKEVNQRLGRPAVLHYDYLTGQDLALLYNAADLLVWLSDYEGFGLPVLESMACGTPVVTSPFGSIPEVAGQAVIYVKDNNDVDEISETIYKGLTDNNLRQRLISQGLEQSRKFSWQTCAKITLDALLRG